MTALVPTHPLDALPAAVRGGPLMRRGGFAIVDGLLDRPSLAALLEEALAHRADAVESDVPASDGEEWRGGSPARRFLSAPGGPTQDAFYRAAWLAEALRSLTRGRVAPSGARGTYTYYARPGDHLALHRDVIACDLALVTCLHDTAVAGPGGELCLYPTRAAEPLLAIRAAPGHGAVPVRLEPGQSVAMLGGIVPHELLPVGRGQVRIVSVLCFLVGP